MRLHTETPENGLLPARAPLTQSKGRYRKAAPAHTSIQPRAA